MRKMFLRIFLLTFLGFLLSGIGLAMAQSKPLFHIVLPSMLAADVEQQIVTGLNLRAQSDVTLHKSADPAGDLAMLEKVLQSPGDGVLVVIDRPGRFDGWSSVTGAVRDRPLMSLGWVDTRVRQAGFDTNIGAEKKHYTDLIMRGLHNFAVSDVLCLFSREQEHEWCPTTEFGSSSESRMIAGNASDGTQMALTVSAMTQNPKINGLFLTDFAMLANIRRALDVIGGQYVLGGLGSGAAIWRKVAEGEVHFTIDPQWILQTSLALSALEVYAASGQILQGFMHVSPRLIESGS